MPNNSDDLNTDSPGDDASSGTHCLNKDQLGEDAPDSKNHVDPVDEATETSFLVCQTPSAIGRYQIVSQLGEGGFGFVYEAYDSELDRRLAIKVPRWDRALRRKDIERFRDEGRTLAKIVHPSIVSVYDFGETDDGLPLVVMEFVDGEKLSSVVRRGELELDTSLELLLKIGEALQEAHKASIVHRDLKPANVMVETSPNKSVGKTIGCMDRRTFGHSVSQCIEC